MGSTPFVPFVLQATPVEMSGWITGPESNLPAIIAGRYCQSNYDDNSIGYSVCRTLRRAGLRQEAGRGPVSGRRGFWGELRAGLCRIAESRAAVQGSPARRC